jgi:hypothetical protein
MITSEPAAPTWRKSTRSYSNGGCVEIAWRKSTHSYSNGDCVEVAWRKSTHSHGNGDCVEVAPSPLTSLVRDSKNPGGPVLAIPTTAWRVFLRTRP